ncbi:MAG: F0F1 ATP synthase subunit A [Pirellulaceae bacterium]|jgi:F-type H+-transporting ATPase subunit a|nr:F0F1 ATP synthase subunit A [Pirellulaceae bacterium]
MADPILHIKDAFFFEVPKVLAPAAFKSKQEFPAVWVRLDPQFQEWEFGKLYGELSTLNAGLPPKAESHEDWQHWVHSDHAHHAKPFDRFLNEKFSAARAEYSAWQRAEIAAARAKQDEAAVETARKVTFADYIESHHAGDPYATFLTLRDTPEFQAQWNAARHRAGSDEAVREFQRDPSQPEWSKEKIDGYNFHLSGKILIPQPFGELRNLHEPETTLISQETGWINRDDFGFCISKFMVIEVAVGIILVLLFSWLGRKLAAGGAPQGKSWNLLELFVVFIRDQIARPALDGHHGEDHGHTDGHAGDGHGEHAAAAVAHEPESHAGHGHGSHSHDDHAHHRPSDTYTPVLCTIFFFILGCNLAGMIPWVGAPTGTWAVTLVMALVTLLTGFIGGVMQFGVLGYFLNQIPSMDLPTYMAVILKPVIFVIELGGLLIKHAVLSVRLLANMLAGHMVLLAIMGLAFGATAAMDFVSDDGSVSPVWWIAATCSVVGCALLSMLELFVAFLQAYVFTLLSALFIGAAIHKH